MNIRFAKYQGTGNDFVMMLDLDGQRPIDGQAAARLCERRLGVGADGTIRVVAQADGFVMDHRNADGSFAQMCGNGARCVGAFLRDEGVTDAVGFDLHTGSGVRRVERAEGDRFTVHMGSPSFAKSTIPMRGPAWETFLEQELDLGGGLRVTASALSMGNPHLVLFVDEAPAQYHVSHIGPVLERDDRFPERVNVEFARVLDDGTIEARVWERGSGETLACGSGACAVAVAANEAGAAPRKTTVRFPGGDLDVERRDDGEVLLTGDARRVFDGDLDLSELDRMLDLRR